MVIGVLIVGWQVYEARQETRIRPGATVSGVEIGGLEPEEAVIALEPVVQEVAETTIDLQFPDIDLQSPDIDLQFPDIDLQFLDDTITFTAEELGISLDSERILAEADNPPPPVVRPAAWLFDLFASRDVSPSVTTDLGTLAETVDPYTDPETPRIQFVDGAFQPVLHIDVPVPDMELLALRLEEAVLNNMGGRVAVEVPIRGMEPADPIAVALAAALATKANMITEGGVQLQLEGTDETFTIGEQALRRFIVLEGEQHDTHLSLKDDEDPRISTTLASLFVGIGSEGIPAIIGLDQDGAVTISDGEAGFKCCHETAADVLLQGMIDGQPLIVLPSTPNPHPRGREWAESLGILQVVGEFTTPFRPAQDRIINIARISELTRGVIIEPGQRFSVNGHVGQRTESKGFVPARHDPRGRVRGLGGRRDLPVRHHAVQCRLLRRVGLHRLPEPHDLPEPLPLRARGHRVVPGARSRAREQHPVRGDAVAHDRRRLDHGEALLGRRGCWPSRPTNGRGPWEPPAPG